MFVGSDTPRKAAAEVVAAAAEFPGFVEVVRGPPYSGWQVGHQ